MASTTALGSSRDSQECCLDRTFADSRNAFADLMNLCLLSPSDPTPWGSHAEAFCAWLTLSLRKQADEIEEYLNEDPQGVRATRLALLLAEGEHTRLVPPGALDAERQLFLADLTVVFTLLGG